MSISTQEQLKKLNTLYSEGHEFYYETSSTLGLSGSTLMILYGLCHIKRPCTQKDLCEEFYLKKQTLHSALNKLIKAGNIKLESMPDNSRRKLIVLTEKGKALCKKTTIPFLQAELKAFERLSEKERKKLLELTQKHTSFIREEAHKLLKNNMEVKMIIRQENKNDFNEVYLLVKSAFETAEHCDGNEQDLVNSLRNSDASIPELSLVAEIEGKLVGHIMFTEAKVAENIVLVLAPLSVLPENQKQGIGTALMKKAHKIARELGYQYSLVLGSEKYYPRVGYTPAEGFGIEVPEGIASANFMAMKLQPNAVSISGKVTYAKEFGI